MPVFNDWTSLEKVLIEINQIIGNIKDYAFDCLIINDASSEERPKMSKPKNFNSVKILNMKKNKGHARCNAFGIRHINKNCKATIGEVSNSDQKNIKLGKAGRKRYLGFRPKVRGVVMNPVDHPHGGGEGRTSGGRDPVTPWGVSTKGKKTRNNKKTDIFIIKRKKK